MTQFPILFSVVIVVRNRAHELSSMLSQLTTEIAKLAKDYELIVVDNASTDESVARLKELTGETGLPNLQVYALTKEVDEDTACWAGLENALGDFTAMIDLERDDIRFLPEMLEKAVRGADVVFAKNSRKISQGFVYDLGQSFFNVLYRWFNGVDLVHEAPKFRIVSKRVINFILQHPRPSTAYRHLPATGGFNKANLKYPGEARAVAKKGLWEGAEKGIRLLVSTTHAPMRIVTALSLFGAVSNLVYSVYVIAIAVFKSDVAPGWVTLSLQQSGMFFLISLVLFVLGEYILHMASLTNEGPLYHVAQEFSSARITRFERLNVESVK